MTTLPLTEYDPPFSITRASHLVLTSRDLAASELFYTQVIGMVLTHREEDRLYLRGLEEACHHSLVIKLSKAEPHCERVGLRVFREKDLELAKLFFDRQGLENCWAEVPFQGRTLHFTDPTGTLINCAPQCPWCRVCTIRCICTVAAAPNGWITSSCILPTCSGPQSFT